MAKTYDVAVLGLGGMGSAAAAHLARRGQKVIGLEQHGPSHDRGSSHGRTRIIRLAYSEHPDYVPLLRRAYDLWRELERETGSSQLVETGGLLIGRPESSIVAGAVASARAHGLPQTLLDPVAVRARHPAIRLRPGEVAFLDERAGVVFPEEANRAHQQLAVRHGAELRFGVKARFVEELPALPDAPVWLDVNGETVIAERVVLAAGAWTSPLAGASAPPLEVTRQVVHWFEPQGDPGAFDASHFPVFIWGLKGESAHPSGSSSFYGIPAIRGDPMKVGFHFPRELADPDALRREVSPEEVARITTILHEVMPEIAGRRVGSSVCMYTSTRDEHFAIGLVARGRVALASPCSGHGFKFAPVVGEILADLVTSGSTRHAIGLFALDRPGLRAATGT